MAKTMEQIRLFKVFDYYIRRETRVKHYKYTTHEFYITEVRFTPFFNKNGEKRVECASITWRPDVRTEGGWKMRCYVERKTVMTADDANKAFLKAKNREGVTMEVPTEYAAAILGKQKDFT